MYEKILEISKKLNSKFLFDYDISRLTWFRAGGKTDIYCVVRDENELEIILNNIGNVPFLVIGNGSNLLIRDGGFKGLVIKLGKSFNNLFIENDAIRTTKKRNIRTTSSKKYYKKSDIPRIGKNSL